MLRTALTARLVTVVALLLTSAASVRADPVWFLGAQYGTPLRTAATAGVLIPVGAQPDADVQPSVSRRGVIIDAAVGRGGQRLAVGWGGHLTEGSWLLNYLLDVSGTVTRTSSAPRVASTRSTYAGVSGGLTLSIVRPTAGIERRVAGLHDGKATVFTWGVGVQVPLPPGFGRK